LHSANARERVRKPFLQLLVEEDKTAYGKVQKQDGVFSFWAGFVEREIKPLMEIGYWFP